MHLIPQAREVRLNREGCNAREDRGVDALPKPDEVGRVGLQGPLRAVAHPPGEEKRIDGILEVSIGFFVTLVGWKTVGNG